jgi:hypothetical protein
MVELIVVIVFKLGTKQMFRSGGGGYDICLRIFSLAFRYKQFSGLNPSRLTPLEKRPVFHCLER